MDSKRLDELLKKYWDCETSLEEEQQLREYFSANEVPDSHKDVAILFQYFQDEKARSLNDPSFDSKVIGKLSKPKRSRVVQLVYNSMRIAAGVIVLVAAVWFVHSEISSSTPQEIVDTYDDPQKAFEETKQALLIISRSFGKVQEEAKQINIFNEAQQQVKSGESQSEEEEEKTRQL
jgi:hypothetical protein